MKKNGRYFLIAGIILVAGGGMTAYFRDKVSPGWRGDQSQNAKQPDSGALSEPANPEPALRAYFSQHLAELSPEKEVLGGKFYLTELKLIPGGSGQVSYEDGHNAWQAEFRYSISGGQVSVVDFRLLPQPDPVGILPAVPPPADRKPKLSYEPKQCQTEPWQQWYESGKIQFFKAPTEAELAAAFYSQEHGIEITDFTKHDRGQGVCGACEICPKDYYFTAVAEKPAAARLSSLGWVEKK